MLEVVLGGDGRAVIHNRETGQEMFCSVPTAFENVELSRGVWVHGHKPVGMAVVEPAPPKPEPVIQLAEDDVLPLPAADAPAPAAEAPVLPDPLDHDADGKKGGARKPADPERAAIITSLKAAKIKFFLGAPTEKLKTLLPA